MKKALRISGLLILVIALGAGAAVYWVSGHAPVQERAMSAYKAGHYQEALPLFKEWAAQPTIRSDPKALAIPVAYIIDINGRIQGNAANNTPNMPPPPLDQAKVLASAQNAANAANADAIAKGADRILHKKPSPGEIVEMTIKEMGNFDFNPDTDKDIPADCHLLDGAKVRLTGYMLPISQSEKISEFALLPSLVGCCFGQPPGPEHIITCTTPPDKAVTYEMDELIVEGTLHVHVRRQDNYTNSIWELDVRSVKIRE